ncbi:MAG: hexokinase, partial [Candidatus Omnitrophica bacterium]|nr:hexokinase [Candidatus Omnitrophota bacterium]
RSARLSASIVFAIVTHIDKDINYYHTVAIDGSLFSKYPHFKDDMEDALKELSWEIFGDDRSYRIRLELTSDGSGIGGGIIAAVEVSQKAKII